MRRGLFATACVTAIVLCTSVVGGQGKGSGPKVKSGAAAPSSHAVAHGGGAKPTRTSHTTTTTTVKSGHGKSGATTTTAAPAPKHARTTSTTTTTTTTTGVTLTPVQQKLQRNTALAQKLQSRLPAGTDMNAAAAGFRNLGQFVAAVNVSKNLGLDFTTLKTAMVADGQSLGQAIKAQRQSPDATLQASVAQRDADALIKSTDPAATKKSAKARTRPSGRP